MARAIEIDHTPPRRTRVAESLTALGQLTVFGGLLAAAGVFYALVQQAPDPLAADTHLYAVIASAGIAGSSVTAGLALIGLGRLIELAERADTHLSRLAATNQQQARHLARLAAQLTEPTGPTDDPDGPSARRESPPGAPARAADEGDATTGAPGDAQDEHAERDDQDGPGYG